MLIIPANSASAAGGFDVANSLRINQGDSAYLKKTFGTSSDRKKWTYSFWIKKASQTDMGVIAQGADGNNKGLAYFNAAGDFVYFEAASGSVVFLIQTNDLYRDNLAWYHFVIRVDTTQGTAANRVRLYVNGTQITTFQNASYPNQNYQGEINKSDTRHDISGFNAFGENGYYFDGYMAEVVFTDGQSLAPTDFGEFDSDSNIWKPIKVSGLTFGTNGFYLDFKASGNLGNDANGGTDLTEVNLAATDQSTDTCTTNFSTLNPLGGSLPLATFSDGNLTLASTTTTYQSAIGTIAIPTTGNWYWEYKVLQTTNGSSGEGFIGAALESSYNASSNPQKLDADGIVIEISGVSGGSNFDAGDIASVEVDRTNNTLKIFKNGSSTASLTKTSLPNEIIFSHVTCFGSGTASVSANFGSPPYAISSGNQDGNGYGNFEYAVPSGYFSLNTKNLAEYG